MHQHRTYRLPHSVYPGSTNIYTVHKGVPRHYDLVKYTFSQIHWHLDSFLKNPCDQPNNTPTGATELDRKQNNPYKDEDDRDKCGNDKQRDGEDHFNKLDKKHF